MIATPPPLTPAELEEPVADGRDISGEILFGMRVIAWTWDEPSEFPPPLSQDIRRFATHWSTGPERAKRLLHEDDVASLLSQLRAMREALEPFARAADIKLCGEWRDDQSIQPTDIAFHVKFGHLRAAASALRTFQREG